GVDLATSQRAVTLAEQYQGLFAAVGVHPHDAAHCSQEILTELTALCNHPLVVAVGETGLDFHRDLSPRPRQIEVFKRLIALAEETSLPLIVHDREAHEPVLALLEEHRSAKVPGVLHCYSGGLEWLDRALALDLYIGIDGPITYTNATELREVAARVPLDRLLLETDCPYLSPKGRPRDRNEPAYIPDIAAVVAKVRGLTVGEIATVTTANAFRLFLHIDT
ncbi:MAG: TatD family hydrolase, partial [Candidatus Zipacnadales bacterium]